MKNLILILIAMTTFSSCNDEFLDLPPTTGVSDNNLNDLGSMQALVYGSYSDARNFVSRSSLFAAAMVRDIQVRQGFGLETFFDHQLNSGGGAIWDSGYKALGSLNIVATSTLNDMPGSESQKNSIRGDMHFLRALIYFDLNNYYTLPSTGYSVPLVLTPIGVNDRVSCALSSDISAQIESDIELARTYFATNSGVANYLAATALAARIYFYHKKYDLAYERANEVISSGTFQLGASVTDPFNNPGSSPEIIFSLKYNAAENSNNPSNQYFSAYQAKANRGSASLNPESLVAQLRNADPNDYRHAQLFKSATGLIFANGKYPTDRMDYIFIRLAELYLTRAEANIMKNNSVSQQDVDDVNLIKNRANASDVITTIPSAQDALEALYAERTKEMAFERGDHYFNTRRLQRGIIKTSSEGSGLKPFSEYADILAFPFPTTEIDIHGLTRTP